MPYRVNGKNLAVSRLMVRGKDADKRMKYLHVGPKGTCVVTPVAVVRVSLPATEAQPFSSPVVIPQSQADGIASDPQKPEIITLPEGEPAVTGPNYLVPQLDKCFPEIDFQTGVFTCNGDLLRKLLTIACEVSTDEEKTIRLRICSAMNTLRIDAYRSPGDQEFCGVLKGVEYDGEYIPGERVGTGKIEKKPQQQAMLLKVSAGRKFRGEGE